MRKESLSMKILYARHARQFVLFWHYIPRQFGQQGGKVMLLIVMLRIRMCWKMFPQLVVLGSLRMIYVLTILLKRIMQQLEKLLLLEKVLGGIVGQTTQTNAQKTPILILLVFLELMWKSLHLFQKENHCFFPKTGGTSCVDVKNAWICTTRSI